MLRLAQIGLLGVRMEGGVPAEVGHQLAGDAVVDLDRACGPLAQRKGKLPLLVHVALEVGRGLVHADELLGRRLLDEDEVVHHLGHAAKVGRLHDVDDEDLKHAVEHRRVQKVAHQVPLLPHRGLLLNLDAQIERLHIAVDALDDAEVWAVRERLSHARLHRRVKGLGVLEHALGELALAVGTGHWEREWHLRRQRVREAALDGQVELLEHAHAVYRRRRVERRVRARGDRKLVTVGRMGHWLEVGVKMLRVGGECEWRDESCMHYVHRLAAEGLEEELDVPRGGDDGRLLHHVVSHPDEVRLREDVAVLLDGPLLIGAEHGAAMERLHSEMSEVIDEVIDHALLFHRIARQLVRHRLRAREERAVVDEQAVLEARAESVGKGCRIVHAADEGGHVRRHRAVILLVALADGRAQRDVRRDLDDHVGLEEQLDRADRVEQVDGATYIGPPVVGIDAVEHAAGHGREQRDGPGAQRARRVIELAEHLVELRLDREHVPAVEGDVARDELARLQPIRDERLLQLGNRGGRTAHDRVVGRVEACEVDHVALEALPLVVKPKFRQRRFDSGALHHEHEHAPAAGGQLLQPRTVVHKACGLLERVRARGVRGARLTRRVADDRIRMHAMRLEHLEEPCLDEESDWLRPLALVELFAEVLIEGDRRQLGGVRARALAPGLVDGVHHTLEDRLSLIEPLAAARPLRALAGKHEEDGRWRDAALGDTGWDQLLRAQPTLELHAHHVFGLELVL